MAADYALSLDPGFCLDPGRAALVVVDRQYASARGSGTGENESCDTVLAELGAALGRRAG